VSPGFADSSVPEIFREWLSGYAAALAMTRNPRLARPSSSPLCQM
jgi:hypothetical protein